MVRVVAGSARGIKLKTVPSDDTKPTLDRVKEAMFSIIQLEIPGAKVLDLFSGNGTLGIEALSRGAESAVLNDCDSKCTAIIEDNLRATKLAERATVTKLDYRQALGRYAEEKRKFDCILLDPPYKAGFYVKTVELISQLGLANANALIVCETAREDVLPEKVGHFTKEKERGYGTVGLTLYRMTGE